MSKHNEKEGALIVSTYEQIRDMIAQLDGLHTCIIQKHEADYLNSYKEHMLRVQVEMKQFKKKSEDFYLNMKKTEKIQLLESSVNWFREESIRLANSLDKCKASQEKLSSELKNAKDDIKTWQESAQTLKF